MKKKNLLLAIFMLISFTILAQEKALTFNLDSIITIINNSLVKTNEKLGQYKIEIQSAEISLKTVFDKTGGGQFKLIVKAAHKWELEKTSTLTFKFSKIINNGQKSLISLKPEEDLSNAIVCAARQWMDSSKQIIGLNKDSFNVEISFLVKNSTTAGIEFEIWGIGTDLSGDYENSAVQVISLTFKAKN